jgi:hypothetical protein
LCPSRRRCLAPSAKRTIVLHLDAIRGVSHSASRRQVLSSLSIDNPPGSPVAASPGNSSRCQFASVRTYRGYVRGPTAAQNSTPDPSPLTMPEPAFQGRSTNSVAVLGERLAQSLPVFLARLGRSGGAAPLVKRRVLAQQPLDFVASLGSTCALPGVPSDADSTIARETPTGQRRLGRARSDGTAPGAWAIFSQEAPTMGSSRR